MGKVESPPGESQTLALFVPAGVIAGATDEQGLTVNHGPLPGLPTVEIIVFTAGGTGTPCEVEIAEGDTQSVTIFVPTSAGLPVSDDDRLTVLDGIPNTLLVLLKTAA